MMHVRDPTVASDSLSSMKLTRTAQRQKRTTKETKPTMKLQRIGGSSGFPMSSPDNSCQSGINWVIGGGILIDSQSSSDAVNEDGNDNSTIGIHGLNKNDDKI
jgi:hypothetical protein